MAHQEKPMNMGFLLSPPGRRHGRGAAIRDLRTPLGAADIQVSPAASGNPGGLGHNACTPAEELVIWRSKT